MLNKVYKLNNKTQVYSRENYEEIAYRDGSEERISAILDETKDRSIGSIELWRLPKNRLEAYHLDAVRSNILRPFKEVIKGAKILEIGAGCGAITRYLGECQADVTALEGTLLRASVTRKRCQDLDNVLVVSEHFDAFETDEKFDVITLIGVLEYASIYSPPPGNNPAKNMLTHVCSLLKPDGKLIIAIENQLGLQYFAGVPEDHTGDPYLGIEGRHRPGQAQTYGRKVLRQYLLDSGFSSAQFMAPFPSYHYPVSIVTEAGFSSEKFDAAALIHKSVLRNEWSPFSPELVWPTIIKNGLALDMTNSFLVLAKCEHENENNNILAYHYGFYQSNIAYYKEKLFVRNNTGDIEVATSKLFPQQVSPNGVTFNILPTSKYANGDPLLLEFTKIVTRENWKIEEIGDFLIRHLGIVKDFISNNFDIHYPINDAQSLIPGACFDMTPHNIIIRNNGTYVYFDQKYQLKDDIPVGLLILLTIYSSYHSTTRLEYSLPRYETGRDFIKAAFSAAGFSINDHELDELVSLLIEKSTLLHQNTSNIHNVRQGYIGALGMAWEFPRPSSDHVYRLTRENTIKDHLIQYLMDPAQKQIILRNISRINPGEQVALWGFNDYVKTILENTPEFGAINIIKIVDRDPFFHGKTITNIEVTSPSSLTGFKGTIIVLYPVALSSIKSAMQAMGLSNHLVYLHEQ